jgi:hypothetical protein
MTHQHNQPDHDDNRQDETNLQRLPLSDLALFCAHALQVFTEGGTPDDLYPLELFRRAVVLRDSAAWGCIYRQFAPFVLPYLLRHPQAESLLQQKAPAALVDAVLSRLSANLTQEKLAHLNSLALLLKYLRVCVHSTIADAHRDLQLLARLEVETAPGAAALGHTGDPQAGTQGLWQVLVEELSSEDERLLFTLLFARGLSTRAVCTHEPGRFSNTEAVYQMKARIFERLRASERLQAILGPLFKGMFLDQ